MTLRQPYEDAVLVIEDIAMIRAGDSRRSALVRGGLEARHRRGPGVGERTDRHDALPPCPAVAPAP